LAKRSCPGPGKRGDDDLGGQRSTNVMDEGPIIDMHTMGAKGGESSDSSLYIPGYLERKNFS
jgi:hypothetical protein